MCLNTVGKQEDQQDKLCDTEKYEEQETRNQSEIESMIKCGRTRSTGHQIKLGKEKQFEK